MKTRCRECMKMRECAHVSRYGGGTYRRGGHQYWSSICEQCAVSLLASLTPKGQNSLSRWDGMGLIGAVANWSGWSREEVKVFFYAISEERERRRREERESADPTRFMSNSWWVDPWPLYVSARGPQS